MRIVIYCIFLSLLLLVGCAHTPMSASYPLSVQHKMQSVHHWDVLSKDVADQIKAILVDKNIMNSPIFVQPSKDTPFGEGFHNMLVTSLVNNGITTRVNKSEDALTVTYESQVVHHAYNRSIRKWSTGPASVIAAGILVLRDVTFSPAEIIALSVFGTGVAADYWAATEVPHTEVIITTSIASTL